MCFYSPNAAALRPEMRAHTGFALYVRLCHQGIFCAFLGHADEKLDSPRSQRRNYSVRTTEVYERRDAKSR